MAQTVFIFFSYELSKKGETDLFAEFVCKEDNKGGSGGYPPNFRRIPECLQKNNTIKNNSLIQPEGDGHGQGGEYLRGWDERGGLADGGQGFVVEEGVATAGEDAEVVDRAVRGDGEGELHLAAPAPAAGEQGIVELPEDGVADGGEVGLAVGLIGGYDRDFAC